MCRAFHLSVVLEEQVARGATQKDREKARKRESERARESDTEQASERERQRESERECVRENLSVVRGLLTCPLYWKGKWHAVPKGTVKPSRPGLVPTRPKNCTRHVREQLRFPKNEGWWQPVNCTGRGSSTRSRRGRSPLEYQALTGEQITRYHKPSLGSKSPFTAALMCSTKTPDFSELQCKSRN